MFDLPNPPPLRNINRRNAAVRLAAEACPLCDTVGRFILFDRGPHVGIRCTACGRDHVFRRRGVFWVPTEMNVWKGETP